MYSDNVGCFIKTSNTLLKLGLEEYKILIASDKEDRAISRSQMYLRQLGRISMKTLEVAMEDQKELQFVDLFKAKNLLYMETALHVLSGDKISKKNNGYIIKKASEATNSPFNGRRKKTLQSC